MDLFDYSMQQDLNREAPLAARLRPRTLDDFVGQEEIIGEGKLLRRAITADRLFPPSFSPVRRAPARPPSQG